MHVVNSLMHMPLQDKLLQVGFLGQRMYTFMAFDIL